MMDENIYGLGTMLYIDIENGEDIIGHDGKVHHQLIQQ